MFFITVALSLALFGQTSLGSKMSLKRPIDRIKTAMIGAGMAAIIFVAPAAQANEVSVSGFYSAKHS